MSMSIFDAIVNHFERQQRACDMNLQELTPYLAEAAHLISQCLMDGKKILTCASSDHALMAEHFTERMLYGIEFERPGLPSLHIKNRSGQSISTEIETLASQGDTLLLFTSTGNEPPLKKAISTAVSIQMRVVLIIPSNQSTEPSGLSAFVPDDQVILPVSGDSKTEQTAQQFGISQLLANLVERQLFEGLE